MVTRIEIGLRPGFRDSRGEEVARAAQSFFRIPIARARTRDVYRIDAGLNAAEAERMGFLTRVVPDGEALPTAIALAAEIAAFPWRGVLNDRRSVYAGLGLGLEEALAIEDELGRATIFADGFREGVARFEQR